MVSPYQTGVQATEKILFFCLFFVFLGELIMSRQRSLIYTGKCLSPPVSLTLPDMMAFGLLLLSITPPPVSSLGLIKL